VNCAKMAELIELPFGVWTRVGPKKHVLDAGAHWCHMIEPSVYSGDAAFCQLTLTS